MVQGQSTHGGVGHGDLAHSRLTASLGGDGHRLSGDLKCLDHAILHGDIFGGVGGPSDRMVIGLVGGHGSSKGLLGV